MVRICDVDRCALNLTMGHDPVPTEPAVPRPSILRVARRVDADEAAAGSDVLLKSGFLARIENIASRVEEYDDLISRQDRVAEPRGVFRGLHSKPVLCPQ